MTSPKIEIAVSPKLMITSRSMPIEISPTRIAALVVFVIAYGAAIPFMNTTLIQGYFARAWHGADTAYFVNFVVAALLYGGWRIVRSRTEVRT